MTRVNRFLSTFTSKSTVSGYKWSISRYLDLFYKDGSLEEKADRYFRDQRNYEEDIRLFFIALKDYAPKTVSFGISGVKSFLLDNGVELSELYWRRLRGRKKGTRALTIDRIPSNAELRKILTHMPIQGKALFLTLASSGMRIGEALSLQLSDLELTEDPARIKIQGAYTKTGNSRVAFLSSEAKELIEEWFKVRSQYLKGAAGKSHFRKKTRETQRLFPFEKPTAHAIWVNALSKSGFEEKDNGTHRLTVHPHVLRKFFRTRLGAVIPVDVTEAIMGHEGYLTEVYRKYSLEDLAKFYKKGEHALLVFSNGAEISKLKEDIEKEKGSLQSFVTDSVEKISQENQKLKKRVRDLESKLEDLQVEYYGFVEEIRQLVEEDQK